MLRVYCDCKVNSFMVERTPQENWNLPVGPEAVADQWRAQARLQISCHGSIIWNEHGRHSLVWLSRVTEKDSWWTAYTIQRTVAFVFENLKLFETKDTLVFWSDGGPHYRSTPALSNVARYITERFRVHSQAKFGQAHHLKGQVDGLFGRLTAFKKHLLRLKRAKLKRAIRILKRAKKERAGEKAAAAPDTPSAPSTPPVTPPRAQ